MLIPEKNYSFKEEEPRNKLTLKKFAKELYYRIMYDEISLLSANLSYYFVLSLFPLLLVMLALTPYFNIDEQYLLNKIYAYAPGELGSFIFSIIQEVLENKNTSILTFGIIFTLWSASNGIYGLMQAFNIAYRIRDERFWLLTKFISIIFTIIMLVGMFIMLTLLVFSRQLTWLLFHKLHLDESFYDVWNILTNFLPFFFTFFMFLFLYIFAPNIKVKIRTTLYGAFFATCAWILVSKLFAYYIDHFSNYIKTYGSIGGIMAFIIWLYITGYILILGAEINAIIHDYKIEKRKFDKTHIEIK